MYGDEGAEEDQYGDEYEDLGGLQDELKLDSFNWSKPENKLPLDGKLAPATNLNLGGSSKQKAKAKIYDKYADFKDEFDDEDDAQN